MNKLLMVVMVVVFPMMGVRGNLRCYSCTPCTEFDYFVGDPGRWEQDCVLDRYCMKISGVVTDLYGYGREVAIRGCPWVSLVTRLEEGCQKTTVELSGLGSVTGEICFCQGHLCNKGARQGREGVVFLVMGVALARIYSIL